MIILLILTALVLLFTLYAYRVTFWSDPRHHPTHTDPLKGVQFEEVAEHIKRLGDIMARLPFEAVSIQSFDGLKLAGRYYHLRDGAPLVILFHGYRSHAFRDCCGGHALSRKMGFNTLVIDQRAHGDSEGRTISFGINERRDCLSWIEYANERFGSETPIVLSGLSMGAATVLMAAELPLPENVKAIMADSPYSTPSAIIEKVSGDLHYPVVLCRPFFHLAARIFGGFRLNSCNAKEAVSHSKIPLLLLHGEADRFVPCSMSREIAACAPGMALVRTFPGAGHGLSYVIAPREYEQVTYDFLKTIPGVGPAILDSFVQQLPEKT